MWGIAHAQGIKLPTKDYWEFRDMITVARGRNVVRRLPPALPLDRAHPEQPLGRSSAPVYEVIGGAYRKNNVTTMELRFNPMKRNRGGEQDLDHIIAAASAGWTRPVSNTRSSRAHLLPRPRIPVRAQRDHRRQGDRLARPGVVGIDIAGPESATFRVADYRRLFRRARQFGLGLTGPYRRVGPVDEVAGSSSCSSRTGSDTASRRLRPAGDGDDPRPRHRPRDLPDSNLNTRVVSGWDEFRWIFDTFRRNEVRFTINTDGPEMLKTYIRDELAQLGRLGILSLEDQERAAETSLAASFVPNVSDVPAPRLEPAHRLVVEREEA
jgi:adenosine deaminase